jgi:HlyD family secretion protein
MKKTILLLLPLFLAISACSKKEAPEAEVAAPVQVTAAARETIHRIVTADAVIFPVDQANVMSKVSAPIAKFYVNRGDHVKSGELIATLENRDLTAAVAAAKAQLAQAEANLRTVVSSTVPEAETKAKTDVQSAQEQFDAARKLLESRQQIYQEGALARKLVDEAQVAFAQAKAQLETAQEHLKASQTVGNREQISTARAQADAARAQVQAAEAQVAFSEVRSPISGIVADRPLYPGDMASTGQPLATIVDISRVVARANVPQNEASAVHVGDSATVSVTGGTLQVPGKVTVVSPAADPNSTTMQVWVQSANPNEQLKPGVSVRVQMLVQTIPGATVVPASAILSGPEGGSTVVTVSADNKANIRPVTLGAREGDNVQILSGIAPGEKVVTTGGMGLENGAEVRIVAPAAAGADEGAKAEGAQDEEKK